MSEITYDDKVDLQVATNIANINKVTASDMNEIKNVVNGNADEVGDITSLTTTDKTSVVDAVNELNAPEKWVSVGATAPTDGTRVWFKYSRNILPENLYIATRTINGITYTNNGDGIISFSGTATANTSIQIMPDSKMSFKAGQPYYLYSSVPYNSTTFNLSIALTENGATRYLLANGTYTPTYNSTQAKLSLYVPNGTTISATNVKLMLIEGNTAPSEYEPYIAEHSIKIDNSTLIGQDNLVSVGANQPDDGKRVWFAKGKNLFDIDNAYHGTISGTGGEGSNEDYRTSYYIPTTPNTTYYFSSTQISGQTSKQIYLAYYDSTKTFISRTSYNLYESAFITPSNCYYIRAGVFSAGQENVMLELGSQKTTYEPYVDQGIYVDNEQWYIKPKILWSGRATSVSVNLTGYSLIEVIFCSNDNFYNSLKVPVSGSTFSRKLALCNSYMSNTMESSSNVFLKYGQATLTQAGITINSNVEIPFSNTAGQIRWQGAKSTLLYITTIIGYK